MANKKEQLEGKQQVATPEVSEEVKKTKFVRNRGNCKVELIINNKVVVFLPQTTVEVPEDFIVPIGIGLYVR